MSILGINEGAIKHIGPSLILENFIVFFEELKGDQNQFVTNLPTKFKKFIS